jgi:hypothetical protein
MKLNTRFLVIFITLALAGCGEKRSTSGEAHTDKFIEKHNEVFTEKIVEIEASYDELLPLVEQGEEASIRLKNGLGVNGTIEDVSPGEIKIKTFSGIQTIDLSQLDAVNSFKFDPDFRSEIIVIEATLSAFQEVSNDYKIEDLNIDPAIMIDLGYPEAIFEYASQQKANGDLRSSFMLFGILSKSGLPNAKRELALMYERGQGVGANRGIFDTLIRQAADEGDEKAQEILSGYEAFLASEAANEMAQREADELAKAEAYKEQMRLAPREREQQNARNQLEKGSFDETKINGVTYLGKGAQIYRDNGTRQYFYANGTNRVFISDKEFRRSKSASGR